MARKGASKDQIKDRISSQFRYDLNRNIDQIRPQYRFDVSCQGSVPEALIAFLESSDYISAIRKAVSLGGDSDTLACIAGVVAEAYYKQIPSSILLETEIRLPNVLWKILKQFEKKYPCSVMVD
jgi:ADP-ribosylglycohydrolase